MPAPPEPEIKLRTMESDIKSVEEGGGAEPQPIKLTPETALPAATPPAADEVALSEEPPSRLGAVIKGLIFLIILIAIAWALYAYVWPLIFVPAPEEEISGEILPSPSPTTPPPAGGPRSTLPVSAFGSPGERTTQLTVSTLDLLSVLTSLQNEASRTPGDGNVKELTILNNAGQPLTFVQFITILLPEVSANLAPVLTDNFEPNFTAYLYYDQNGVWPGYIVKKKAGATIDTVTLNDRLALLETSSFANLFLIPPGEPQGFRTGTAKNQYTDRYNPHTAPGASFNYGIFNSYLIINTSFDGLLAALQLLGL